MDHDEARIIDPEIFGYDVSHTADKIRLADE
jgi:hypothetical protein